MASPAAPAPSKISTALDGHLTTIINCMQNVVYVTMLLYFIDKFMSWVWFTAIVVSPVESWKGLFYNMWISVLVCSMMLAFKDTLEAMILFENFKRHRDCKKDATTIIAVDKDSAQIRHVDNDSSSSAWQTVVGYIIHQFLNKDEKTEDKTKKQEQQTSTLEATTPVSSTEDEIKQDAASASSSTRSSADTAEAGFVLGLPEPEQ
jgi:hypothetical protein